LDLVTSTKHWEQQDGEPVEAYRRFCVYLHLGVKRTLLEAYRVSLNGRAKKRYETLHLPGNWIEDSSRWHWVERAARYDIAQMAEQGTQVITRWVKALEIITQKTVAKLEEVEFGSKEWRDAVDAVCRVGAFVPAESVRQLQDTATAGEQPGIGNPSA